MKVEGGYFFKQGNAYSAYDTETPTDGYFLLNAGLGADFMNNKKLVVCRLFLSAQNLLDKAYFSHLSRLKYAPENPVTGVAGINNLGRNLSLKLVVPIGIK